MAKGGPRPNSGRKTKAEELQLPAMIDEIAGDEGKKDVLRKVLEQAKAGSFPHQQLFLAYAYGKPTEKIDVTSKGKALPVTGMVIR